MAKFEFGFEEQWLRLTLKNLPEYPELFLPKNVEAAQAILRMGKLKVGAAKVWAESIGLIKKVKNTHVLTPLGQIIAKHDPDFDEDGIWWAIHYLLASHKLTMPRSNPEYSWFYGYYVHEFDLESFTRTDIVNALKKYFQTIRQVPMTDKVCDTLIYNPLRATFEATRLGTDFGVFIQDNNLILKKRPQYKKVPKSIFAFALLDFAQKNACKTTHLSNLLLPWSVGKAFLLTEDEINDLLVLIGEVYAKHVAWISYTAGLNSVSIMNVPPAALIATYYYELDGLEPYLALEKGLDDWDNLNKG